VPCPCLRSVQNGRPAPPLLVSEGFHGRDGAWNRLRERTGTGALYRIRCRRHALLALCDDQVNLGIYGPMPESVSEWRT
jgi:hypothetical protein